jgi:hypothetical protein
LEVACDVLCFSASAFDLQAVSLLYGVQGAVGVLDLLIMEASCRPLPPATIDVCIQAVDVAVLLSLLMPLWSCRFILTDNPGG